MVEEQESLVTTIYKNKISCKQKISAIIVKVMFKLYNLNLIMEEYYI